MFQSLCEREQLYIQEICQLGVGWGIVIFKMRCVLERKSMAAYSVMSVFHSKSGKGWGDDGHGFSRNTSDGMDLECHVST